MLSPSVRITPNLLLEWDSQVRLNWWAVPQPRMLSCRPALTADVYLGLPLCCIAVAQALAPV